MVQRYTAYSGQAHPNTTWRKLVAGSRSQRAQSVTHCQRQRPGRRSRGSGSGRGRGRGLDRTSSSSSSSSISPLSGHLRRQRQQQQHTPAATEAQAGERGEQEREKIVPKKKCSTTTNWGMRYTGKYKHCIVDLKIDLNLIL